MRKLPVSMIHGELTSEERKKTMNEFKSGQSRILLSTDLLSRGIDIQQLSLVINFDLPLQRLNLYPPYWKEWEVWKKGSCN